MSTNPPGPPGPPGDTPPGDTPPAWIPPPAPAPEPPPSAPPLEPAYPAPQGYAAPPPPAAAPRRGARGLLAVLLVVVVVVVAVIGYGVAGYAFASSRIDSARSAYNEVITRQNALADTFNSFTREINALKLSTASTSDLKQAQTAWDGLVTKAQAEGPSLTADDASLAAAQTHLRDNEWLTVFSRSRLDQASNRIGHERLALAAAQTITTDLVQLGNFYHPFLNTEIDLDDLIARLRATDLAGLTTATAKLKADTAASMPLSGAPGLPSDVKSYLVDLQSLANDFGKLIDGVNAGDETAVRSALNAINSDGKKVDSYDWTKIANQINAFYQPLIDKFNSEVNKANNS